MRTSLPTKITSKEEAKAFLKSLHDNNESFHPEDDPATVGHSDKDDRWIPLFTAKEAAKVEVLMEQIYDIKDFDACGYLLKLGGHNEFITENKLKTELQEIAADAEAIDIFSVIEHHELSGQSKAYDEITFSEIVPIEVEKRLIALGFTKRMTDGIPNGSFDNLG